MLIFRAAFIRSDVAFLKYLFINMIRFSNLLSSFRTALTQQNKATYISGGQDYRQAPNSSMGSFIYTPRSQSKDSLSEEEIEKEARSIF